MLSMWISFGVTVALIALIILWCSRIKDWRRDRQYNRAYAAWKAEYEAWKAENPDQESWRYKSAPTQYNRGYHDNEGWAILSIFLGLVALSFLLLAILIPVFRNYDERQCGRKEVQFERETKFVVYGSGWSWECLTRSKDGRWVTFNNLTEIRGEIVTHEGEPVE